MGWTYGNDWRTKNDIIEHCTQVSKSLTKLDHAVRGNNLWLLLQVNEGERKGDIFVTLILLQKDDGIYGYKEFDDTSQPYHYNCPIGFIKRTVASGRTLSDCTKTWHEKVFEYHAMQRERAKKRASVKAGMKLKFQGVIYELISKYSGKKGWLVKSLSDNATYRMKACQISLSQVVTG
jgi:hypothetical protein